MIDKDDLLAMGNNRLRRLATYASISVAGVLIFAKLGAYFLTDSIVMLSSLLDSTIDLLASLVTAYGVANALKPPDRDHRFGHGKAESLAALTQAAFIIGSSVLLVYEALDRLYHPHEIQNQDVGYGVTAFAALLTVFLISFQRYVIKRTGSMAIHADWMHYVGDLVINVAVAVSFFLQAMTHLSWFDPVFAIAIATGLSVTAFHIVKQAINVLMDRELPEDERTKIKHIVLAQPSVRGIHDMRTRTDSDRIFVELHVEMDATMSLKEAHEIAENIVAEVKKNYPTADVLIHEDPVGLEENRLDAQIEHNQADVKAS